VVVASGAARAWTHTRQETGLNHFTLWRYALDARRAERGDPAALLARQQARLAALVRFARARSPLYATLYEGLPADVSDLDRLPPVTKRFAMANFDSWVTDPRVSRGGVEAFMAEEQQVGRPYLGRYAVWSSSGITAVRGIFLHDQNAVTLYRALTLMRGWLPWMTPQRLRATLRLGNRIAAVVVTGGHHGGVSIMEAARREHPWPFNRVQVFSPLRPLSRLVDALNVFRPALLLGYPDALTLLAREQLAGRLAIRPALVGSGGDWLAPPARQAIGAAFGCRVRENYGATEFPALAWECPAGSLHVGADWAILEAVDERYRPVPAGQPSHTALLTNLVNRVQPFIRYELGDRITLGRAPCPCGSALPHVQVEGRRDDLLYLEASDGATIPLLAITLTSTVVDTPGVQRYQVIQTGPTTLRVRLEVAREADEEWVWEALAQRLRGYLAAQGLPHVDVVRDSDPPRPDPVSGKFRRVWIDARGSLTSPPRRPLGDWQGEG
jgi:phenylacetate-coenzyme A ligase PaaK-like adenylate-forming protein